MKKKVGFMRNYKVIRKCLNQKTPMVSIPKTMYEMMGFEVGKPLELTLNQRNKCIEIRRAEDDKNN